MALEGARFWRPYQLENLGGQRRDTNGVYASITALYWTVDGPKNTPIGYRNPDGSKGTRAVFDGNKTVVQTSSMSTSNITPDFSLGTRVEIGNYRDHHGWLFSGYGLSEVGGSYLARNGSMVIQDSETLTAYPIYGASLDFHEIWEPDGTFTLVPSSYSPEPKPFYKQIGYLWAWYPVQWTNWLEGRLAPVPINFDQAHIQNSVRIMSFELMYTYRPHPFKWGGMELLAGARYWDFDDKLNFLGMGYAEAYLQYLDDSSDDDDSSSSDTDYDAADVLGETNSNDNGPLTVIADSVITGRVRNRIVGPQFGVKLNRRNARWTFGAEARFMAGINTQSQTVSGTLGTNFINTERVPQIQTSTLQDHGILPYIPIGLHHNTQTFYHHRNKTYFSPGVELRLTAKWQWTDAVALQVGFDTTIFDNIGRGADIIEYRIFEDGTLFGIRDSKTTVITYGVNFGLTVKR